MAPNGSQRLSPRELTPLPLPLVAALDKKIITPAAGCGGLQLHSLDDKATGGPPEPLDIMGAAEEDQPEVALNNHHYVLH